MRLLVDITLLVLYLAAMAAAVVWIALTWACERVWRAIWRLEDRIDPKGGGLWAD